MGTIFRRYPHLVVLLILGASLGAKVAIWQVVSVSDPTRFMRPDSVGYLDSARALWELGRFAISPTQPDVPQLFRTPGYPVYLATIYTLTGSEEISAFVFSQLLLSILVMGLAYWFTCRLWNRSVATIALVLLAFDLPFFAYSLFVMSETLFTLLLLISLLALSQTDQRMPIHWRLGLAGIVLGMATLVRPVGYYLVLPLSLWLLGVSWHKGWSWRAMITGLLVFVLPYLLLVGGWQWRNYRLTGSLTFSTVVANNLLLYRGAGILALRDGIPIATVQEQLKETLAGKEGQELYQHMQEEGLALLRRYPGLALQTQLRGALTMMLGLGDGWLTMLFYSTPDASSAAWDLIQLPFFDYLQKWVRARPIPFVAFWGSALQVLVTYVGIGCWLLLLVRRKVSLTSSHLLLWVTLFYFVAVSAGPEANSRFRAPLAPLLTGYAAAGLYWVFAPQPVWNVVWSTK